MAEVAEEFLEAQVDLRPRTKHAYRTSLERHVLPRLGRRRVADITETDTVSLIAHLRRSGLSGRTVRSILTPFGRCLAYATRHGLNASNPMRKLERGERPPVGRREMRILDRTEIARLIDKAPPAYRTMLATAERMSATLEASYGSML
jgi:site-specific recombinase XerD